MALSDVHFLRGCWKSVSVKLLYVFFCWQGFRLAICKEDDPALLGHPKKGIVVAVPGRVGTTEYGP
jgi:hypothetical protein